MRTSLASTALAALLLGCTTSPNVSPQGHSGDAPVEHSPCSWSILVFRSTTCGACDILERTTLADLSVQQALRGVPVEIVNADYPRGASRAREFLATAFPTTVFLCSGQREDRLMGAVPAARFLTEWERIRHHVNDTVTFLRHQADTAPRDAVNWRHELGVKLVLLGDLHGAERELRRIETDSDPDREALAASLRQTLDEARYLLLSQDVQAARAAAQLPYPDALEDLLAQPTLPSTTRYRATRLLLGIYDEHMRSQDDPQDRGALPCRRRAALRSAWSAAPRPLTQDTVAFGVRAADLLWEERASLLPEERELAADLGRELSQSRPGDLGSDRAYVRGLWMAGRHDGARAEADQRRLEDLARELRSLPD
jgi:hypothetical protein